MTAGKRRREGGYIISHSSLSGRSSKPERLCVGQLRRAPTISVASLIRRIKGDIHTRDRNSYCGSVHMSRIWDMGKGGGGGYGPESGPEPGTSGSDGVRAPRVESTRADWIYTDSSQCMLVPMLVPSSRAANSCREREKSGRWTGIASVSVPKYTYSSVVHPHAIAMQSHTRR